jgi:hypothetical protein
LDSRKSAILRVREFKRERLKSTGRDKLQRIVRTKRFRAIALPSALDINGALCYNREVWLDSAQQFGNNKYADENNNYEAQAKRIDGLSQYMDSDSDRHLPEVYDVLQARARLKPGTAPGTDGIVSEMWKKLPFSCILKIHELFLQTYEGANTTTTILGPYNDWWYTQNTHCFMFRRLPLDWPSVYVAKMVYPDLCTDA